MRRRDVQDWIWVALFVAAGIGFLGVTAWTSAVS